MKICIKENSINPSFFTQKWATNEIAQKLEYQIIEIPENCYDCDYSDFYKENNLFKFDINKYNQRKAELKNVLSIE